MKNILGTAHFNSIGGQGMQNDAVTTDADTLYSGAPQIAKESPADGKPGTRKTNEIKAKVHPS